MDGSSPEVIHAPWSEDAERAVLGALMIDPTSLSSIADWLTADDFFARRHRMIFAAISSLIERREPCDAVTLSEYFRDQGAAADDIGPMDVIEIANNTPSAANIVAYAEIIAEHSRKRQAMDVARQIVSSAMDRGSKSADTIAEAIGALSGLQVSNLRGGLKPTGPLTREFYADLVARNLKGTRVTGLATPWHELNDATHGFEDGQLIYLAARPNMGKTVAALNLADWVASNGHRVAVFSLEMTATQVIRRCVSARADIPHDWLLSPGAGDPGSELNWSQATRAHAEIGKLPLLIDDTPQLNAGQIVARAKRAHLQQRLRLVIVDHVHLIRLAGRDRTNELGDVSSALKGLAKDLGCPIVALAQLNRGNKDRTDKRPVMTDLRQSGDLEQDADLILFLHREDYYDRSTHMRGVVELEIAKGRDVRTGTRIHLENDFEFMRLKNWSGPLPEKPVEESKSGGIRKKKPETDYRTARDGE